jgi:hypothetical protein
MGPRVNTESRLSLVEASVTDQWGFVFLGLLTETEAAP